MCLISELYVIKKDGTKEPFDIEKVEKAIKKSADRVMVEFTDEELSKFRTEVKKRALDKANENKCDFVEVVDMHRIVEASLDGLNEQAAKSYRDYRNYKTSFVAMLDDVFKDAQKIMYLGDRENSNTDSALVSTKRSLIYNSLNKELYKKFFLRPDELQAVRDGYIYVHDMSARRDTMNCFDKSTKFVTNKGVKSFSDFNDGDAVVVPTHTGEWKNATVRNYGKQKLRSMFLKRSPRSTPIEIKCTDNHRWILDNGLVTTNISVGDRLFKTPVIADIDWSDMTEHEKLLWCLGFIWGDGSNIEENISKNPDWAHTCMHLRLCRDKIKHANKFEECGFKVTFPPSLDGDAMVRSYDHLKHIPENMDQYEVKAFITGLLAADGHINKKYYHGICVGENEKNPYRSLFVTGDFNDLAYDMLNIAGYWVSSVEDHTGRKTNFGTRTKKSLWYRFQKDQTERYWTVIDIKDNYYEDDVWCLEVEDNHSFILDGGIVTGNCCLCDISEILTGGFELANQWYTEPKSLDVAFDVIGDIVLSAASQQYGGFTVPQIDQVLYKYAKMSYDRYYKESYDKEMASFNATYEQLKLFGDDLNKESIKAMRKAAIKRAEQIALEDAENKIRRDFQQGFQGWEYKFNTVASSRGDYPFITMTFGLGTKKLEQMASIEMCNVRAGGQGKEGFKRLVLFPKLVILEDSRIHGKGKVNRCVYDAAIKCSSTALYPDWLSLEPGSYVGDIYQKYGKAISPMGKCNVSPCKTFLTLVA